MFRPRVEHVDAVDEGAAVREVAIVHAGIDATLRNGIGLPLKRPAGMDDQLNVQRTQSGFELRAHGIAAPAFADIARLVV
ncbi:hypothetical protein D3C81_1296270 [compost metagenome]